MFTLTFAVKLGLTLPSNCLRLTMRTKTVDYEGTLMAKPRLNNKQTDLDFEYFEYCEENKWASLQIANSFYLVYFLTYPDIAPFRRKSFPNRLKTTSLLC